MTQNTDWEDGTRQGREAARQCILTMVQSGNPTLLRQYVKQILGDEAKEVGFFYLLASLLISRPCVSR